MADTPSSILLLRLQGVGGNVNTWGGYLNTALSTLEQASKGYQSLAVTGNAIIAWTQYQTGNIGQCAALLLTGSLASPAVMEKLTRAIAAPMTSLPEIVLLEKWFVHPMNALIEQGGAFRG